jgi:hypothetical protein
VPLCSVILLLPLFVDNIIISINWNYVVILVIVSFIIDLLDLHFQIFGGRHGRDRMVVGFTTQSVPITTNFVSLNPFMAKRTQYNIM